MSKPIAIDLFCGLGGWTDGLLEEGYDVIGFDIERHEYGDLRYPGRLVIQDVTTLHGSQFKSASLIVASPPCQEYSYMAMPWRIAKEKAAAIRADSTGTELKRLNRLFDACFRIQREACDAAGRHIPLIVENVRGAQNWVGRARWSYGSFYLWGDVPALMPITFKGAKVTGISWRGHGEPGYVARGFNTTAEQRLRDEIKNTGGSWFNVAHNTISGKGRNPDGRNIKMDMPVVDEEMPLPELSSSNEAACGGLSEISLNGRKTPGKIPHIRDGAPHTKHLTNPNEHSGLKTGGRWFGSYAEQKALGTISPGRMHGSKSKSRKMASAMIAKIPLPLSRHIAATFRAPV